MKVILDVDHSAPVISTQLWVETGSIHEGEFAGGGISHLLEHMVFKGTKSFSGSELSEVVQAAGGEWNAYTTFARTVYYIDGPCESAEVFLQCLTEMVFHPAFPEDEFEKEKDVIRREIEMGEDDPDDQTSRLLYSTVFGNDPRKYPVIGFVELFNELTHADMCQYHADRYTPENAFLSISGSFEIAAMIELLESLLADVPRRFTKAAEVVGEPKQLGARVRRKQFAVPSSKFALAWQTPSIDHDDAPALDLLATIFGAGRSSRLYQNLREKLGLCHHIGAWCSQPPKLPGMFAMSAVVDHSKREQLREAVLDQVQLLLSENLSGEIEKAVRMALSSQFSTLTTASGRSSDLASNWHEARSLDFTRDYVKSLSEVTAGDLRRVAEKYLVASNCTEVSLDPLGAEENLGADKKVVERGAIETVSLDNGLRLILCQDARVPQVYMTYACQAGLLTEIEANAGINALLATVMTKGTVSRSAEEIALTMDSMGASYSISAGNNTTMASAKCLSPDLGKTLGLLADMIINPALPSAAIEREKETQLAALREQANDPMSSAFREARAKLFGATGYGLHSLGTESSIIDLDRMSLSAHHSLYFRAENSVISIFGDIDRDEAIAQVVEHFAAMPSGKMPELDLQPVREGGEVGITLDKQQAVLVIAYPGVGVGSTHADALELIHEYCSDMAGPLFTRIREELGLAYYVSATQFHGVHAGMFAFYMGTSPDQIELARTELCEQINLIAEQGIPDDELENVKTTWLASNALANQKNSSIGRGCAIDSLLGLGVDYHQEKPARIKAITAEQIRQTAQHIFAETTPVSVTVMP
ncbi:M16 family metallopeptidase [Persicirhabdus sediminis]|uniref:Insulinase family protein n=1 Tax=Persicirhabdus sediminis TaxID=454144 RepID=A0A8J7MFJ9_9BACT|nr:pitrilysin family protein [Persicirhabdus sediminis]MBK1791855.1 insulinase family protein [Persicirhabdus sediminis]